MGWVDEREQEGLPEAPRSWKRKKSPAENGPKSPLGIINNYNRTTSY